VLCGQVGRERLVELRGIDRELDRRLTAVRRGIVLGDERTVQDAVLGPLLHLAQTLPLVRGEGGDEDEADDVLGLLGGICDHRAAV
jgi:hypothetical protein